MKKNLEFTQLALTAIKELLSKSANKRVLRIAFVYGCGGSGYRLSFEDSIIEGDIVYKNDLITISLDAMSCDNLDGGFIDCVYGDDGPELIIDHPNAVGAPLCGW